MRYELKLANGRTATWDGKDGEDAAERFVDSERVNGRPDVAVIATRAADRYGLFVLGGGQIIG